MPTPKNLIHETSTGTGTGNLTVAAVNGKVRFSDGTYGFGTGGSNLFDYFLSNRDAAEWEIGTGHMLDANTLVRDTVVFSSNANALVNFSAGDKDVANDLPAAKQYVGSFLVDSATIDFTYNDATPSITADVKTDSITNTLLADMAQATVKGRANGAGTGDPTDLTSAQLTAIVLLEETTIEAAIDTLPNLTLVQGLPMAFQNAALGASYGTGQTSSTPTVQIVGTGSTTSKFGISRFEASAQGASAIYLMHSRHTTPGSHEALDSGDLVGTLVFGADDGTDYRAVGDITVGMEADAAPTNAPTFMAFRVLPTGSVVMTAGDTTNEAFRLNADRTVSFRGNTVDANFSDAGFDALFGWDDGTSTYKNLLLADIATEAAPAAGDFVVLIGAEGDLRKVDWSSVTGGGYTDEQAQDAVGGILVDSATIDFTYNDATPSITAIVIDDSITNAKLANMTQATIKGRADGAGTGDPTDLTAAQVATIVSSAGVFQPLDADLTSWAGVTRAAGFDTFVATPSSANLAALVTNETGTGALVFGTSPVLTTPQINDTSSDHQYVFAVNELSADRTVTLPLLTGNDVFVFEAHTQTLTNKTINLANNTVTGTMAQFNAAISDGDIQPLDADLTSWAAITRAAGFDTFVATPSSANLAALVTNETGTGALVFASGPVLTAPEINDSASDHQYIFAVANLAADRTVSLPLLTGNDTFVFEAHTQTLTNKTINLSSNTLTGTMAQFNTAISDGNIQPEDATLTALAAFNTNGILVQTAADTFAGRTIIGTTNEVEVTNGDGVAGNPTIGLPNDVIIATSLTLANTGLHLLDTNASHDLIIAPGSNLTADRTLTLITGDASVTLDLTAVTDEFVLAYDTGTNTWRGVAASGGIPTLITVADESADTSCFVAFFTAATGDLGPKTNANLTFNSNTGALGTTTIELGHASDTTLARVSAGVISVEGIAFTPSDAGFDALFGWDDSAATYKSLLLADIATEGAPAAGDFVVLYGAEGDLRKVNWSSLPGASSGIPTIGSSTDNALARWNGTGGNFIQDSTWTLSDAGALIGAYEDASVDTVIEQLKLRRTTSGTPGAGIGTSIAFEVECADGPFVGAIIEAVATDVGSGTESFALDFKTMDEGAAAAAKMRLTGGGNLILGPVTDINPDDTEPFYIVREGEGTRLIAFAYSDAADDSSNFVFAKAAGTRASPDAVADNEDIGRFDFQGFDGTDFTTCAVIGAQVAGTVSSGVVPGRFYASVQPVDGTHPLDPGAAAFTVYDSGLLSTNQGVTGEAARRLEAREETSLTNAVAYLLRLSHRTDQTPAAGIGVGLEFEVQTATTPNYEVGARLRTVTTNVGSGTEDFDVVIDLMAGGAAAAEKFRVTSVGDAQAVSLSGTWVATQAQQVTGTAVDLVVTPGRQRFHPSAAKFWVYWTANSTTILASYNVDSIADTAVGDADGTITTDFSSANWAGFVTTNDASANGWDADSIQSSGFNARAAGTFGVLCGIMVDGGTAAGNLIDPQQWQVVGFGTLV